MPQSRKASVRRKTRETEVVMRLNLDGSGQAEIATGLPFLDHLLTAFAMHARIDLALKATGDLEVDEHHTVEDVAIVLGEGLQKALAGRMGIQRYGSAIVPLDESRALAAVDCGGRPYAVIELPLLGPRIGTMPVSLLPHFLETLALKSGMTLHISAQGRDEHHVAEAAFKALGRALRQAIAPDPTLKGRAASTKGRL